MPLWTNLVAGKAGNQVDDFNAGAPRTTVPLRTNLVDDFAIAHSETDSQYSVHRTELRLISSIELEIRHSL